MSIASVPASYAASRSGAHRAGLMGTSALTAAVFGAALCWAGSALALPVDGQVLGGSADISYGNRQVTVDQHTDRAIIEWRRLDIGADETMRVNQPTVTSVLYNTTTQADVSQILGRLVANGQIILHNPNGIVFGPGADIDVQSIVATTIGIDQQQFMDHGVLVFDDPGLATAVIGNAGEITAAESGLAAFVAPGIENSGIIQAEMGTVALVAGNAVTLDFYGDGLIQVAVTEPTQATPVTAEGEELAALISHTGAIHADGGTVIMTAEAAVGVVDAAINLDGIVQARSIGAFGGQVALVSDSGLIEVAGTIDVSGDDAGEVGGTVHVLGEQTALQDGATIDASGEAGGGTVLVGGDQYGGAHTPTSALAYLEPSAGGGTTIVADPGFTSDGYIPMSDITYVDAGATVAADATDQGDGGTAIVWGTDTAEFYGSISATGGANGGDGGSAEVSSGHVTVAGAFDLSAAAGQSGSVLIDPTNLCAATAPGNCTGGFSFVDIATIVSTLQSGTDFTLDTSISNAFAAGDIEVVNPILYDSANALTFLALGNVTFNASVQNNGAGAVNVVAGWDGTTADINTILTTPTAYGTRGFRGLGNGTIFIGNGSQTAGIAVGSRFGASNFAGVAMTLLGSDTTVRGFAQAGFRDDSDVAAFNINGAITIALSDGVGTAGNLIATAGSEQFSFAHVGHGGSDFRNRSLPDGDYAGDITIVLANDLTFTGGSGRYASAQLGHGGESADGNHSGNILITQANNLTFTGGTGATGFDAYAQLGHGGDDARGSHSGTITITRANDLIFQGGARGDNSARLGHGGDTAVGDHRGNILISQANNLLFSGGGGSGASAQLGHGGDRGSHTGDILITQAGNLTFTGGDGFEAYAQLGNGGANARGNHGGTITITQARDLTFVGGTGNESYAQLGHGGHDADGDHSGAIDVTVLRNLTLTGQDTADQYALIGHGDDPADVDAGNTVNGNVTVSAGGTATLTNAFIGHLIDNDGTYTGGNTFIGAGLGLTADALSQFNSAPTGQLRIYVPSVAADGVNTATLLNGIPHGADPAPNNQGQFAFGTGPYAPSPNTNFAYYTLDIGAWNYIVNAPQAASIVTALGTGAVTLDTLQNLAQFGALPDLDGGTSFILVNADIVYSSTQPLSFVATGDITFNANVQNTSTGNLVFNAPTVNLDGNLTAGGGISGTASTVNVLGSTGGAQIQDAIDAAVAGATINIAAGTYAGYIIDKENLTVSGVGAGTIINTSSPAVVVNTNGATVENQLLQFGGGTPGIDDIGILLNGDPTFQADPTDPTSIGTANLTGINIVNVDFRNLDTGIRSQGDIGDGNAATVDVTIRGNSNADRAVFEDFQFSAIDVGDTDGDAVYVIRDIIIQDGADPGNPADNLASLVDGIRLGNVAAATVQGVNMTHNVGSDGIFFTTPLTNANILIGGPTAADANTILGQSDGIDISSINGGTFTIQGNTRIFGVDDGIDFNGTISNNAIINIVDNIEISANEDAIDMNAIIGGSVTIARNQLIQSSGIDPSDAIEFGGLISGNAVILINANIDILGGDDGIDAFGLTSATFTISNNTRIIGADDGIDFDGAITDSNLTITGNQTIQASGPNASDAIELSDPIGGNSVVLIDGNTNILGADDGIDINDDITGGTVTISNNALIQGAAANGIEFVDPINGTAQVAITGNTAITGALFAIDFQNVIGGTATVTIDGNGTATQNGAAYDGTQEVDLAGFVVTEAVRGGAGGIQFADIGGNAAVTVSRNMIDGSGGNGIGFNGGVASTQTTAVHNNVITNNGGNGIAFAGIIASRAEVFQNFIARNGGNGVLLGRAASVSPNILFVQQNFIPGVGFTNGNGGFGYSQLGVGSPNLEANWWGTPDAGFVASINGVAPADLPTTILASGVDTNFPTALGATGLDPFAFQAGSAPVVEPPVVTPADAAGLLPFLPFFGIPGFGLDPVTPGDASFRGGELIALLPDIFGVGYGLGQFAGEPSPDGGVGGLEPAAGDDTEGVGGLEPAAGGDDACVETFFADYWTVAATCEIVGGDQTAALQ